MIKSGHIFKKNKLGLTSLNIVFPTGSIYEKPGRRGISHLMEHLITKSVDKYMDQFTNDCIDFNASTSQNYVVVYFRGLEDKLPSDFKKELVRAILNDYVNITPKDFENEKKIVMQELLDTYEDPNEGNYTNLLYNYFDVHDPTGIPAEIEAFTYEEMQAVVKEQYSKPLRIIEVGKTATDFSDIEYLDTLPDPVQIKYKDRKQEIFPVTESEKVNVFVFSKIPIIKTECPPVIVGMQMLCEGLNSPFCQEIRETRGLSYYVMGDVHLISKNGVLVMNACTDKKNAKELEELFRIMCANVEKYLTRERYNIIINQLKTMFKIKKCLKWKNVGDLINMEMPNLEEWINDGKINYEKLVGIMQKYFYEIKIIAR